MPPNGHALLSASAADRWLHCPPSARLCELYEDKGSDYAAEGTDAHTFCEYKLRKALGMETTDPTENLTWFNQEMDECANDYVAYILELVEAAKETCADPVVLVEQRVDFSRWVEQGFGTSDAILIADGTMHVIDYKHGLGIVWKVATNPEGAAKTQLFKKSPSRYPWSKMQNGQQNAGRSATLEIYALLLGMGKWRGTSAKVMQGVPTRIKRTDTKKSAEKLRGSGS